MNRSLNKANNIARLKELGIYYKWKLNVLKQRGKGNSSRSLESHSKTSALIMNSFSWAKSKEGHGFWDKIYDNEQEEEKRKK